VIAHTSSRTGYMTNRRVGNQSRNGSANIKFIIQHNRKTKLQSAYLSEIWLETTSKNWKSFNSILLLYCRKTVGTWRQPLILLTSCTKFWSTGRRGGSLQRIKALDISYWQVCILSKWNFLVDLNSGYEGIENKTLECHWQCQLECHWHWMSLTSLQQSNEISL